MIAFSLLFGLIWGVVAWDTMQPFPEADGMIRDRFGLEISEIAYVGMLIYIKDEYGNRKVHWPSVTGIGMQSFFIGISFILIFFFGFKCYRQTQRLVSTQSTASSNLQTQLFYALVLQTLIPTCLLHIPASFVYAVAFSDNSKELYGQLLSVFISLYPALDPLPNFFIIKSYRKAIKGWGKKIFQMKVLLSSSLIDVSGPNKWIGGDRQSPKSGTPRSKGIDSPTRTASKPSRLETEPTSEQMDLY
uniref:G_PROTEIN_RECEP_F1_2 domain-containing protein n=1 Tax=Caenorhabditis tropicalis TaxID=1561998 RepID=A0A1I7TBI7_9PELO